MAKRAGFVAPPEPKKTPYRLGRDGACSRRAAMDTYNAAPPDPCPFQKGTPEEAEYDRGWKAQMEAFDRRGD
jgi:hypothetical protein